MPLEGYFPEVFLLRSIQSGVPFLFPNCPVGADRLQHGFSSLVKPLSFLFLEMAEDGFAGGEGAEMDVGGFPSHGVQKAELGPGGAQRSQFDAGTVRAETTDDPASAQLDERIGTAHGAVDDDLVKNFGRALVILSPVGRGWDEGFGFASDASAMPFTNCDVAGVTKAAETGNAMGKAKGNVMLRHEMLKSVDGADRRFGFESGKRVHFCPEVDGIAEFALRNKAKPLVVFAEHESAALCPHAFDVTFEDSATNVFTFEGKASGLSGEMSADGQTYQVDDIGHRPGFIKIVDSPDEAAFNVAPGAEIFNVKIANGKDVRSFREVGTDLGPNLRPAVKGGAEEGEEIVAHARVF